MINDAGNGNVLFNVTRTECSVSHPTAEQGVTEKKFPKMSKSLLNQPVNCPWTSRAPLCTSRGSNTARNGASTSNLIPNGAEMPFRANHLNINTFLFHKSNFRGEATQQSSSQFFHFLRLMQLFPDVHPATLHTVMTLCKNDFFTAVDKLLYAKRYKNICMQRRNFWSLCSRNKLHRHQPPYSYSPMPNGCIRIGGNNGASHQNEASVKQYLEGQQMQQRPPCCSSECEISFPSRSLDSRRFVYRNRVKKGDSKIGPDLPPVASPHCELPIRPLSPMSDSPEDLSSTQMEVLT